MPLYTKKDFAEICFTTTSDLFNYIRRGKVIVNEGDLIDSSNEINAAFVVKRQQLQMKKVAKASVIPTIKANENEGDKVDKKKTVIQPTFDFPPGMKTTVLENFQDEAKLKKVTLEKAGNEIKLQELKIQKQQGEVIPTQLVLSLIAQHSKSITIAFRNGSENLLTDIAKKINLSGEQLAELRGLLIKIINTSVDDSIKDTSAGLKHIVSEYTKQRGVGESE